MLTCASALSPSVLLRQAEGKPEPEWEGPAPPLHVQKKLARKANFLDSKCATGRRRGAPLRRSGASAHGTWRCGGGCSEPIRSGLMSLLHTSAKCCCIASHCRYANAAVPWAWRLHDARPLANVAAM